MRKWLLKKGWLIEYYDPNKALNMDTIPFPGIVIFFISYPFFS